MLTIDFFSYLSHFKYILKIEKKTICIAKRQRAKFEIFNNIYDNFNSENTNMHVYYLSIYVSLYMYVWKKPL